MTWIGRKKGNLYSWARYGSDGERKKPELVAEVKMVPFKATFLFGRYPDLKHTYLAISHTDFNRMFFQVNTIIYYYIYPTLPWEQA